MSLSGRLRAEARFHIFSLFGRDCIPRQPRSIGFREFVITHEPEKDQREEENTGADRGP